MSRRWIGAVVLAAAIAVAVTWGAGGFGGGGGSSRAVVLRGNSGWTMTAPSNFHRRSFRVEDLDFSERGFSVGNFVPLPSGDSGDVPAKGVLFQLDLVFGLGALRGADVHVPLRLSDFQARGGGPPSLEFEADGYSYVAHAAAGPDATQADRRALARIVSSVRFPSLRTGEATSSGYYVLKRPSAYPVGTIVRVEPPRFLPDGRTRLWPFYLVHDDRGLSTVGWQPDSFLNDKIPCAIRLDRARRQFVCPGGGGRWDLSGNVIVNPPGASQPEPLGGYETITSQGHLLVSEFTQYSAGCAPSLARRLPACPNYQPLSSSSRTS